MTIKSAILFQIILPIDPNFIFNVTQTHVFFLPNNNNTTLYVRTPNPVL